MSTLKELLAKRTEESRARIAKRTEELRREIAQAREAPHRYPPVDGQKLKP